MHEERIAEIVGNMDFVNKTRITKKGKKAYVELADEVSGIKKKLDKLNIRLWHSGYKGDYHSLSLTEAETMLREIAEDIEKTAAKLSCSGQ
jgi:hypothetical protein